MPTWKTGTLLVVVTYIVHRCLVLHTAFDQTTIPVWELPLGNVAWLAQGGWRGPSLACHYENVGGHIAAGLLATPLYMVLGPCYLALKLMPVLLGAGTIVLLSSLVRSQFGTRAAMASIWFFAFGPPLISRFSVVAMGSHFENVFFQVLVLCLFFRLHQKKGRRLHLLIACGVAAGFAVFFFVGTGVLLLILVAMHVYVRRVKLALRDGLIALPPFLLGVSPLIWVNYHLPGKTAVILSSKIEARGVASYLQKAWELAFEHLPQAAGFRDWGFIPNQVLNLIWIAVLAASYVVVGSLLISQVRSLAKSHSADEKARFEGIALTPFLLHLPVVLLIIVATKYQFKPWTGGQDMGTYRYLVASFTLCSVVLGVAITRRHREGSRLRRRTLQAIGLLALGAGLANWGQPDWKFGHVGRGMKLDGYNLVSLGEKYSGFPRAGSPIPDVSSLVSSLQEFSDAELEHILFGFGFNRTWLQSTKGDLSLEKVLMPYPQSWHAGIARGFGAFLKKESRNASRKSKLGKRLAEVGLHDLAPYVIDGFCLGHAPLHRVRAKQELDLSLVGTAFVPAELQWAFRGGLGFQCGRFLRLDSPRARREVLEAIQSWTDKADAQFWFGLGRGLASKGAGPMALAPKVSGIRHRALVDGLEFSTKRWTEFRLGDNNLAPPPDLRWRGAADVQEGDSPLGSPK